MSSSLRVKLFRSIGQTEIRRYINRQNYVSDFTIRYLPEEYYNIFFSGIKFFFKLFIIFFFFFCKVI